MIYRFENCVLDIDRRELCRGGIVCPIEPQVFDLLHFLIANRDRVVSRDEIFQTVWRGRFVSESVLGNRINAVRKALGDDGIRQGLIRTVHRKGFRFVGAAFEQAECKELPDRGNAIILRPGKVSLAVLPMTIWPGDLEIAYISKGLAEDLTVALARSRSFDVIAHDRICIGDDNVMRIAREFAAAYLVVCSLRKADDSTRLSVRLIDACTDIHLWAQTCTYGLTNRFADEDAITARIAAAIESQVFAAEEKRQRQKPLEELNATDYVLKAIMLTKVRSQQNYASAQRFLSRAIELDPYCARAHAIAAYFFGLQVLWGWKPRQETIPLAVEAAHNAIVLDDHDPWAHFAFGWALTQNRSPEEAIEAYEKAIAINPYFPPAYAGLGLALGYVGQIDKALTVLENGERLGVPEIFMGLTKSAYTSVFACAEKCGDAIKAAQPSIQQSPWLVGSQRQLVVNYALAGEMEQARAAFKSFVKMVPDASLDSVAGALPYIRDTHLNRAVDAFRLLGLT